MIDPVNSSNINIPILYSFRCCPYAIRARMALAYANICYEHREILLINKPQHLLKISPKGTVPVLLLSDGTVLEESLDIMFWALQQSDINNWLPDNPEKKTKIEQIIKHNDTVFKNNLNLYKYPHKYANEYPNQTPEYFRECCEQTLQKLESLLEHTPFLTGLQISIADIAIFPFIRQFAKIDNEWFQNSPYLKLQQWLTYHEQSHLFLLVMKKYPAWEQNNPPLII